MTMTEGSIMLLALISVTPSLSFWFGFGLTTTTAGGRSGTWQTGDNRGSDDIGLSVYVPLVNLSSLANYFVCMSFFLPVPKDR